jgi:peptidoglycan hydrolase CwlO-like protein
MDLDKEVKQSGTSKKTVLILLLIFVIVLVTGIMSKVGNTNTRNELEQYCVDMQTEINELRMEVQSLSKEVESLKK